MDSTMSKIFETLNLNSISAEMHNLSLNELKSSLASLGQFVIVGKFGKDEDESAAATEDATKDDAAEGVTEVRQNS